MVFGIVKTGSIGLMESPKVGIIILVLLAASVLIGGWAGWQMRERGLWSESQVRSSSGTSK